jgi:tetratricopeptide (TPR) repeat protein
LGERGWVYLDQKQYEQALETFDEALALDPDNMLPILGRVLALRRLYRNGEALRLLQEFKLRYPADVEMRVQLGWFHIGQNDAVRARKEFESILKVEPLYPNAVNGLGAVYFNQGIYEEAENWFRTALGVEPNEPAFHTNLAWALVRETGESSSYTTAPAAKPKWYRFLPQDTKLLDHKYLSESEEHCRAALELESDYGSAYGCLGVIAFKKGRFLEAEDFFLRGTRANPRGTEYVALGALYTQMGRHEEAKEAFKEALLLDKNDSRALVELGNLYLQLSDTREATRLFRQAMHTNLNDEEPPRALAIGLMRSGEYGEAGRILRRALRQLDYSKRWRLHLTLSQLLTEMGEKNDDSELYEEALKEIKEAISLNPQRIEPYFHAGVVRFKLEDYRGALRDFRFCLEKDPDHFDAERNVRLVQAFTKEERRRTRGSLYAGIVMGVVCILMLIVLWALYLRPGVTKISETMVITFSPILLALSLVAFLLPWLIKLKLPGVEAELSQPKEKISKGPTGAIGFGTTSISSGPR